MTSLFGPEPLDERITPEGEMPARPEPDPRGGLAGQRDQRKDTTAEAVARLLDPVSRYVALHDDLPSLRRVMGPAITSQVEDILQDLLVGTSQCYAGRLRACRNYGEYLDVISEAADDGEDYFHSVRRVHCDLTLSEESLRRVVRLLRYRLISYLEMKLCSHVQEPAAMKITHEAANPEAWVCLCGNTPLEEGFYPCNREGHLVEPTPEEWTTHWYVCARCGRMIDQRSLEVAGMRRDIVATDGQALEAQPSG